MELDLLPLLDEAGAVFHLAARPGVRESWGRSYEHYNRQNVLATQRLLDACTRKPPRRLVYASSSSIYGEMPGHPVREDEPARPISPYGVTKLAAEHLVMAYHRSHGIPAVSLRYFTVYGPRQRPDMAFHRFLRAIHTGGEITLYGDGSQTRDVTYVGDVVKANLAAMRRGRPGRAYNVGGGHRVSLNDALEVMQAATGRRAAIRREPRPTGDPLNTGADMTLARRELDFDPQTSLEEGIGRMSRWMEDCLGRGL
jgi:UDP-glucuronate 4-epimerase